MPHRVNLRFLDAPGDVARLMREHDWTQSPLGPPVGWPQSLRSVVSLLLRSKFPMFVAWGPSLGFLYNVTGHELARRIRARLGEGRCVLSALSGYGQPRDIAASRQAGMDHHLIKPLDYDQLRDVLAGVAAAAQRP